MDTMVWDDPSSQVLQWNISQNPISIFGQLQDLRKSSQPINRNPHQTGLETITLLENMVNMTKTGAGCGGLLSATNSNTDTSNVEDDGISVMFSDYRSLWSSNGNGQGQAQAASTSGESNMVRVSTKRRSVADPSDFELETPHFELIQFEDQPKQKKHRSSSCNINFQQPSSSSSSIDHEADPEAIQQMKEMIYRAAAFRPVDLDVDVVEKPKRKNVKISSDPQTVAARMRREKISDKIRVLQKLVPGGSKMDTASMLDEAANYLKYLRSQVKALEILGHKLAFSSLPFNPPPIFPMQSYFSSLFQKP